MPQVSALSVIARFAKFGVSQLFNHSLVLIPQVSALSVIARFAKFGVRSTKFRVASGHCVAFCFCFASCDCCHDPFIVRSAQNLSTVRWFHTACTSVSMFTTNADNCLFLCSCLRACVESAAPSPDPSQARHLDLVVQRGIHGQYKTNPANLQCCCSIEAEIGFVPTSAQFFAVGDFLDTEVSILNSFLYPKVQCVKGVSFAVVLSIDPSKNSTSNCHFVFSIFIGIPRSWYIDLRCSPT